MDIRKVLALPKGFLHVKYYHLTHLYHFLQPNLGNKNDIVLMSHIKENSVNYVLIYKRPRKGNINKQWQWKK